jgi:branched-subunit amino acid aminotransferase/4-amino-4-deoxychorismate lyase
MASKFDLYGCGVFSTIRICDGMPFLWEKHWRRLTSNADRLGIDLSEYTGDSTRVSLEKAISKKEVANGRARITFLDESPSSIWSVEGKGRTTLSIITGEMRSISSDLRLTISPYPVNSLSPLTGIKSCNYLEKIIAVDEAKARGFDEATQVNERGEITSAVMANVFWWKGETLFTPSLKTGCLPGTTREFVLENLECREVERPIDDLHSADAIFLTSAGLGVLQVAEFESRKFESADHPILNLLPKA